MSGRYENEMQIEKRILSKLQNMPSILTEYYYSLIGSGKSYATADEYIKKLIQFMEYIFDGKYAEDFYSEIKSTHINKYISAIRIKNVDGKAERTSDSYKTMSWSALNSFFQFLIPEHISSNPVSYTKRPKMKDNPQVTFLTTKEMNKIFNNVKKIANARMVNRDLCILKIGFATGLRISAIIQIDIDDLDLPNNRIKVTEKGDHDEHIIIGENLKSQIKLWLEDRDKYFGTTTSNALFVSQRKSRISAKVVREFIEKYTEGITDKKVTPHVMRHSCATNLYEKTGDIYLCAKQLHHKNVATTQRYAELSKEKQKKAASILDSMI